MPELPRGTVTFLFTDLEGSTRAATPEPLPAENRAALLAVLDVRELAGGRMAALVDVVDPSGQPLEPARFYYVFAEEGARWLIDEQAVLGPIEPAQIGTPAP